METRPKIKLTLSPLDTKLELTGKLFLVVMWGLTLYTFLKMPPTIPIHFNVSGKADGYGNKMTVLILPILATIIYVGFTALNKHPYLFNYMTTITDQNAEKQYTIATRMLRKVKLAILVIFSLIILFIYFTTTGVTDGLGSWFLPFTLGLIMTPTVIAISQSLNKKNKGV